MKVLIVDDSAVMRAILKDVLVSEGLEVVAEGRDGQAAVELCERLRPDAVIMDYNMPVMNGVQATATIMKSRPTPILIFSTEVEPELIAAAMKAGAADVRAKPDLDMFNNREYRTSLVGTLRQLSGGKAHTTPIEAGRPSAAANTADSRGYAAVVIGASTGGPLAVREVLSALPATFPIGVALVQHIEDRFAERYGEWLNDACALSVRIAKERDRFEPGTVVVAPGDRHLICSEGGLRLDDGPKLASQRPAVDRLFETAAAYYRNRVIGVLLTGMGADGAAGCVKIKEAGGLTLVQDEGTSTIYGMPRAAAELGGAVKVLPLSSIGPAILHAVGVNG